MPEAAHHVYRSVVASQNNIGRPGKATNMDTEAEAPAMEQAPHEKFGLCILSPDAGHHPASGRRVDDVDHPGSQTTKERCPEASAAIFASTWGVMMRATSRITGTTTLFPNWR